MTSLFNLLNIGAQGLSTHARGVQIASNNATNVNTPGYARRSAELEPLSSTPGMSGGVRLRDTRRVVDPWIEGRTLAGLSEQGASRAQSESLQVFDAIFAEESGSIGNSLDAFQSALTQWSAQPGDLPSRRVVLAQAEQVGRSFAWAAESLDSARAQINGKLEAGVASVNDRLTRIASLGNEIVKAELGGNEASDLRDQRDQLLREVAKEVPLTVLQEADGRVQILLAGSRPLVSPDGSVNALKASRDPATNDVRLSINAAGVDVDIGAELQSGNLGGLLQARDGGLTRVQSRLDQLAADFANTYNSQHSAGVGLDGVSGRNLFEPLTATQGAAKGLRLSADVAGDPNRLAGALDATRLPGDNRGALAMRALVDARTAQGGTLTLNASYASLMSEAGSTLQVAKVQDEQRSAAVDQLEALRQSVSGVSTDEEMVSLMKFQRAYEASLRVVQTADQMLAELMQIKR